MQTTFMVDYDQTDMAPVLAAACTGSDDDPLLAAEHAYNEAVKRLTGRDPGVRFDYAPALDELLRDRVGYAARCTEHEDCYLVGAAGKGLEHTTEVPAQAGVCGTTWRARGT